jgi:uncharacterized protein
MNKYKRTKWVIKYTFMFYFLISAFLDATYFILHKVFHYPETPGINLPRVAFLISASIISFVLVKNGIVSRMSFSRQIPVKTFTLAAIIVIAAGMFFELFDYFFPLPTIPKSLKAMEIDPLFLVSALILAPINEEIIFRGIITMELREHHSERMTIILSGLSFGIIHINPAQVFPAAFGGIFLAWLYIRTGNLKICMVLHFIYNLMAVLYLKLLPAFTEKIPGEILYVTMAGLFLLLVHLLFSANTFIPDQSAGNVPQVKPMQQ